MHPLVIHAKTSVWCEPLQDRQYYITPARLSPHGGAFKWCDVAWESVPMPNIDNPDDRGTYHVYHIGQIPKHHLNLNLPLNTWCTLTRLCEEQHSTLDVYLNNGCILPRQDCYFCLLNDKNILLAVRVRRSVKLGTYLATDKQTGKQVVKSVSLNTHPIIVRFYTNAWYDGADWFDTINNPRPIKNNGVVIKTAQIARDFKAEADEVVRTNVIKATERNSLDQGVMRYYVDGYMTDQFPPVDDACINEYWGYEFDQSIIAWDKHNLKQCPTFISELDKGKRKYLLVGSLDYPNINYFDDCDFYIGQYDQIRGFNRYALINRSEINHVRQVTHTAYALRADIVDSYLTSNNWLSLDQAHLLVVVRQGAPRRGLVNTHNRIEELYRLSKANVIQALTGVNSALPEWNAANLENSSYVKIMRSSEDEINLSVVEDAYGYNTCTKLMANPIHEVILTPNKTAAHVILPAALQYSYADNKGRRSIFGYNQDGLLVSNFTDQGVHEIIQLPREWVSWIKTAECFNQLTHPLRDGTYLNCNVSHFDLHEVGFRAYVCNVTNGVPSYEWEDVTGSLLYSIEVDLETKTAQLIWRWNLLTDSNFYPMVRINQHILFQRHIIDTSNGVYNIEVEQEVYYGNNDIRRLPHVVEPAMIDVFLDSYSLIEGLDYHVNWPDIHIVKRKREDGSQAIIDIRAYGHCDDLPMKSYKPREWGFVKDGLLSVDGKYDVRNDRCIRVIHDGKLKHPSEVSFSEDTSSGKLVTDGRPYSITDYVLPIEHYLTKDTQTFRELSMDVDNRVGVYLSNRVTQRQAYYPQVKEHRWDLFSPFSSSIIEALLKGYLGDRLTQPYTNVDIAQWMQPFLPYLEFDPCLMNMNSNYVVIHPHTRHQVVGLNQYQYSLLAQVNRDYLSEKLDMVTMLSILS